MRTTSPATDCVRERERDAAQIAPVDVPPTEVALESVIDDAFAVGMAQHRDEILEFARWAAGRNFRHVIEIGMMRGGTVRVLSAISSGRIIGVDLPGGEWGLETSEECERRNAELEALCRGRFVGVIGDSHDPAVRDEVATHLKGERADLLFIDGDHSLDGVRADYEMYGPLVRPGGWIAFHDINDTGKHRDAGCYVADLWKALSGERVEFNIHAEWGGIGAICRPPID